MTKEKKQEVFRMFRIAVFSSMAAVLVQVFMGLLGEGFINTLIAMFAAMGATLLFAAVMALVMAVLEVGYNAKKAQNAANRPGSGGDVVITGGNGGLPYGDGNITINAGYANGAPPKPKGFLAWIFE
jgi:hypothetical protein